MCFLVSCVGGIDGEARQGFFERHALLTIPATRWVALLILACDGGMQTIKRVWVLNRKIGTIGNTGSGVQKLSPGISTLNSHWAESVFCHILVGSSVSRLHRRDHAELSKSDNVFVAQNLRVFDAMAPIFGVSFPDQSFIVIKDSHIGIITNGVSGYLKVRVHCGANQIL